ncbi:MAG: Arc family DNA-binding protein [Salinivirgaceae bacterium]|nr:Arc family DNA-binding protein [Salinivirgaceae bacterium]MDD4748105.1 Arc family DNA-binding protein [Salinivirgaceae bacterium]MDY0281650.1 Arc family DNA-binding protein [Salinivirgaceae bacterium]
MAKKKTFVLRTDQETFDALEKWASDEFRSVNGQIEYILDQALKKSGRWKKKREAENPDDKPDPAV